MKLKSQTYLIAVAGLYAFLFCQTEAAGQDNSTRQFAGTEKGWTARIVSVTQPARPEVEESSGRMRARYLTSPPKDKKWLLLDVELMYVAEKNNEPGLVGIDIETLGVAEDSAPPAYSLYALGFGAENFPLLTAVSSFRSFYKVRMSESGAWIAQDEIDKNIYIASSRNVPARFQFLFPVWEATKQFSFHFGIDYSVPVKIGQ